MTIDPAQFRALGAALLSEFSGGVVVTISGVQYDCIEAPVRADARAQRFGFQRAYRTSLKLALEDIDGAIPDVRSSVTFRDAEYRIIDRDIDRIGGIVTLHLEDR